ncbi:MAG: Hsp70 family protein [bacterium]|nr:Hsp70 family protein [bacterium]
MKPLRIGIDLGTTFSCMAYLDESRTPTIIPNRENKELTPSIVLFGEEGVTVGDPAYNQLFTRGDECVQSIKRLMGDDTYRFKDHNPTDISAEILKKLKSDAEEYFQQPVNEAVITVPAYFGDAQRRATREAGEKAGFKVLALPNEPTAAAIYYGVQKMRGGEKILVYDLGGGTFDASVLLYENDDFHILSNDGSRELGGKNWTEEVIQWVNGKFEALYGIYPGTDSHMRETIAEACENAKKQLSKLPVVDIPLSYKGRSEILTLTREEFDNMTEHLLMQSMAKVHDALEKASLDWGGLDTLLLVGGSTRLKQVEERLAEESGKVPVKFGSVDTIVALGAAIYTGQEMQDDGSRKITVRKRGAGITVKTLRETTTFGLGTLVEVHDGQSAHFESSLIIEPRAMVPAQRTRADYKTAPNQTRIDIPVVQVNRDGLSPDHCELMKGYVFTGIPQRSEPSSIEVTFKYDKDNIIDVDAVDLETGSVLKKDEGPFVLPDVTAVTAAGTNAADPVSILILLDTSGSMCGEPLEQAKQELEKVCRELLQKEDVEVGLIEFGWDIRVVCPLSNDIQQVIDSVADLEAGNGTPMKEGLELALDTLTGIRGDRYAVLISDGFPNRRKKALQAAEDLKGDGVTLYTISIEDGGAEFLQGIGDGYRQIDTAAGISEAVSNLLKM